MLFAIRRLLMLSLCCHDATRARYAHDMPALPCAADLLIAPFDADADVARVVTLMLPPPARCYADAALSMMTL